MIKRLAKFRAGMAVKRYHTVNMLVEETVGHHSANVAWIICNITRDPSAALLKAALLHDVAEQWTGDVPATAKWMCIPLKRELDTLERVLHDVHALPMPELTEAEHKILKQADMLDLCFKMTEEINMGNRNCLPILDRGLGYLLDNEPNAAVRLMVNEMRIEI